MAHGESSARPGGDEERVVLAAGERESHRRLPEELADRRQLAAERRGELLGRENDANAALPGYVTRILTEAVGDVDGGRRTPRETQPFGDQGPRAPPGRHRELHVASIRGEPAAHAR